MKPVFNKYIVKRSAIFARHDVPMFSVAQVLGAMAGYAISPARDLGLSIIHYLIPMKTKGSSDWGYEWVPVFGSLAGVVIVTGVYLLVM